MRWILILALSGALWADQIGPRRIPPPDVERGDHVVVEVRCGGIVLKFEAEAQSSAHIGESIILKNPENGRRFIARVQEKGKVLIQK